MNLTRSNFGGVNLVENGTQNTASETKEETISLAHPKTGKFTALKTDIYKISYITGANLIRQKRRVVKRVKVAAKELAQKIAEHAEGLGRKLRSLTTSTQREIAKPVRQGFAWTLQMEEELAKARQEGRTTSFLLGQFGYGVRALVASISYSRNYILPLAAMALFAGTVYTVRNMTIALSVEYGGEHIGYVMTESEFVTAEQQMKDRIVYEEYVYPEDAIPKYTLKVINAQELTEEDELTDKIIKASGNELREGYGLYVDNRFVGATDEKQPITLLLSEIKDKYRTGDPDEQVEFLKEVEIKEGLFPLTSVADISTLQAKVSQNETERRTYTVQKGDAPILIAQKYNMALSELKQLNPEIEKKLLIGQEVLIQQSVPILGVQVVKTEVYNEEVPFKIVHIQDKTQLQGYTKVQQMGQKGVNEVTARVTFVDGIETQRTILETKVLKEPVEEQMIVGGMMPLKQLPANATTSNTNFIWPVDGGYLSCGFYGYYNHGGMDIATKAGTAVRAAASGTVEIARYYTGNAYGKYVVINHGGGTKTLYAHNSEVYVQVGEWVEQGQLIAAVGRTGNATGNHCHFEIIIDGVRRNPANYIGTNYNR